MLTFIQSRQPILSDAELRMKEELEEMSRNFQTLQKSFDQVSSARAAWDIYCLCGGKKM